MKIILISSLITILFISNFPPNTPTFKTSDVNVILSKSEENLTKACSVAKIADTQQKEEMIGMKAKIDQLTKERNQLQKTLTKTQNELQTIKTYTNTNLDTGSQSQLFPEN